MFWEICRVVEQGSTQLRSISNREFLAKAWILNLCRMISFFSFYFVHEEFGPRWCAAKHLL